MEGRPANHGRVLVVDDDPALSRIFVDVLGAAGFTAELAGDGRVALSLLESGSFDAVVSDLALPGGMDGMELLRAVRQRGLELPVIFITGSPQLSSAMQAVEFGAFRYLLKPVDAEQLVEVVERAVRIHKLAEIKREAKAYLDAEHQSDHRDLSVRFTRAVAGLELAFQPIVRWAQKRLVAYEALLRTSEPSFARPEKLVAAAETLGRIHELGRAIRNRAAERMQRSPMRLFVNLHSEELLDEELYDPDAPLSRMANRTVLEITERAGLERVPDVRARLGRLRQMGFSVAVDDLGAGYSGLSSFVQLDPQVAKLDIALVRNLDREPTKRKLVRTITSLCKELGITVLAEGIESCEERDALEGLGCDLQQGFLFARPGWAFPAVHW